MVAVFLCHLSTRRNSVWEKCCCSGVGLAELAASRIQMRRSSQLMKASFVESIGRFVSRGDLAETVFSRFCSGTA